MMKCNGSSGINRREKAVSLDKRAFAVAIVTAMAAPNSAWAYGGGGPGCSNLPEYDRAIGALQGLSSCDISIEDARRIVAAHGGQVYEPDPPVRRYRHRRVRELEQ